MYFPPYPAQGNPNGERLPRISSQNRVPQSKQAEDKERHRILQSSHQQSGNNNEIQAFIYDANVEW